MDRQARPAARRHPPAQTAPGEADALKSVEVGHEELAGHVFPELRVGLLHGRMKGAEKEAVRAAILDLLRREYGIHSREVA